MPMQPSRRSFTKKPTSKKAPLGKVSIEKLEKRTDFLRNKLIWQEKLIKEQNKFLDIAFKKIDDLEVDVHGLEEKTKEGFKKHAMPKIKDLEKRLNALEKRNK